MKHDELLAPPPSGGCARLSDQEVIARWMGWRPNVFEEVDPIEHLGMLWEVEERLTEEQWYRYEVALARELNQHGRTIISFREFIHATPEQKIKALAAVLRPLVTEARGPDGPRASSSSDGASGALLEGR